MEANEMPIYTALIAGFFAILGAVVGSIATTYFSHLSQAKLSRHNQRHQVYAEIMGKRALLMQLLVSRFGIPGTVY